jgi:hypothetical protein
MMLAMIASKQSLTFSTEPWLVALSVVVFAATLALSYFAWRRSGFLRSVMYLELLRCAIVAAGAVLLNQPEWVQEFRSDEKPALLVLSDSSQSMQTKDVLTKNEAGQSEAQSRATAIESLLKPDAWNAFGSRMDVRINSFPSDGKSDGTDINGALNQAIESSTRVLGVVLLSDGDWNAGQSPMNAAMRYRAQGVPILSIPVGSSTRLPDIELLSVDTPTFGITNKAVRIPFTIESSLPRDHVANVVMANASPKKSASLACLERPTQCFGRRRQRVTSR